MVGGVQLTVPNDDVAHLHPELRAGANVTLNAQNVADYLIFRVTEIPFSNNGRMKRQEAFFTGFVRQLQERVASAPEAFWSDLEENGGYLQTSITRSEYLSLAEKIRNATFDEREYYYLDGSNARDGEHDAYMLDDSDVLAVLLKLFYIER